ncbi:MAG TPA: 50S ribosomal protein L30 [Candidatus Krumholzibacteriaceae bacterium]|nr:50S ribosomal protein L30 [Candidatus Krumholzibacteriaceae bacterium]
MAKKLKVTQIKSIIGSQEKKHKRTMRALGFRRNYRTLYKNDSPEINGMLRKVSHLVQWEEIDEKDIPVSRKSSVGITAVKGKGKGAGKDRSDKKTGDAKG